jgi:hypothetical protein
MKNFLQKLWYYFSYPYKKIKIELEFRKKLKKIREQDPFIYD